MEDKRILPSKKIKKGKDVAWNYKSIKNEVAKGIINGNSVDKIAKRLSKVIPNRNEAQLTTHARTMVTSAQNQGRMYRLHEAKEKGINVKKKWLATLDMRTRYGHAILDGQVKDIDEPFVAEGYELMEPGDPTAHPSLVYNCRCRIDNVLVDYPDEFAKRRDNETGKLIKDMDYKEWYKMKTGEDLGPDLTPLKKTQHNPKKVKTAKTPQAKATEPKQNKPSFVEVKSKAEAKESLGNMFATVEPIFMRNDEELIVRNTNQLLKLNERFKAISKENDGYITATKHDRAIAWTSSKYGKDAHDTNISLVNKWYKDKDTLIETQKKACDKFWKMPCDEKNFDVYSLTHEYGHVLESYISRNREDWEQLAKTIGEKVEKHKKLVYKPMTEIQEYVYKQSKEREVYRAAEKKQAKTIIKEIIGIAKENNPEFDLVSQLSEYGRTNDFEAFAEIFANSQCGKPNELGKAMNIWLEKEGF